MLLGEAKVTNESFGLVHSPIHYLSSIQCFPIYSILLAIGQKTVDYFSLDVEGSEPAVLRSIPFDKVDIKLLTIQWIHCGKKVIRDILEPAGYHLAKEIEADVIYVKILKTLQIFIKMETRGTKHY